MVVFIIDMTEALMIRHRQVEAFSAVVRTGSTVAAARSLHTSQPTISRLLAQLRDQVGFQLFNNLSGKLVLTEEGKQFYRDVEQFLMSTEELDRRAWQIRNFGRSTVRVASIPCMNLHVVPEALAEINRGTDDLTFSLTQVEHHKTKTMVAAGKVDIGLCNEMVPGDTFQVYGGVSLRCMLAVHHDHPLANRACAYASDLPGQSFISLGDNLAEYVDDAEAGKIIRDSARNFASSSAPVIALVEAGTGIGIVDPVSAAFYAGERINFLRFEPAVSFPIHIIYPHDAQLSLAAERLCGVILRKLRDIQAHLA